jgi:Zn-finger domain-containing protein
MEDYKTTKKIVGADSFFTTLEKHMGVLSNLKTSMHFETFKDGIKIW